MKSLQATKCAKLLAKTSILYKCKCVFKDRRLMPAENVFANEPCPFH